MQNNDLTLLRAMRYRLTHDDEASELIAALIKMIPVNPGTREVAETEKQLCKAESIIAAYAEQIRVLKRALDKRDTKIQSLQDEVAKWQSITAQKNDDLKAKCYELHDCCQALEEAEHNCDMSLERAIKAENACQQYQKTSNTLKAEVNSLNRLLSMLMSTPPASIQDILNIVNSSH